MEVAGRDPEMLTLALRGISNVTKHLMELKGSTSESKPQDLESFIGLSVPQQVEILPPKKSNTKGGGKRKGGKNTHWRHKSEGDFVKLMDNKQLMIAEIALRESRPSHGT